MGLEDAGLDICELGGPEEGGGEEGDGRCNTREGHQSFDGKGFGY